VGSPILNLPLGWFIAPIYDDFKDGKHGIGDSQATTPHASQRWKSTNPNQAILGMIPHICMYIYILSHIMPSHHLGGPSWSFESCRIHLSIFEKYCSWGIKNNKKHRFLLHIFSADQLTSSSIFWEAWEAKQPSHPPTARLCPPLSVISWLINHSMYWSVLIYICIYIYMYKYKYKYVYIILYKP
jgi:hypothetical protein